MATIARSALLGGVVAILGAAGVLAWRQHRGRLDPEVVAAVGEITAGLDRAREPEEAALVRSSCQRPKDACDCVAVAARHGLDAHLGAPALDLLGRSEQRCKGRVGMAGMKAEALARVQRLEEAHHQAEVTVSAAPGDMYANLALGLVAFEKLSLKEAEDAAERALAAGRGAEAHRLLGRIALSRGAFELALDHFSKVIAERPRDAEAAFTAAMCNANMGRYNAAREGFVRVLRIDPKHVEARLRLALMSLEVGARMEAEHHLRELREIAPNDPRLEPLEAALSSRPPGSARAASSTPAP